MLIWVGLKKLEIHIIRYLQSVREKPNQNLWSSYRLLVAVIAVSSKQFKIIFTCCFRKTQNLDVPDLVSLTLFQLFVGLLVIRAKML